MKPISYLRITIITFLSIVTSLTAQAQKSNELAIPHEGFWVIETPAKGHSCIIRFYTDTQKLIYEETIERRLNIAQSRTKRQLNASLEQAMFIWNATHQVPADRQWVAIQLHVSGGNSSPKLNNK